MLLILADFSREQFCLEGFLLTESKSFSLWRLQLNWANVNLRFEKVVGTEFLTILIHSPFCQNHPKIIILKTCRVRHLKAIRPMKVPGCGGWFPEFRKSHPLHHPLEMGHLSQGGQWSFRSNVQAKFRGGGGGWRVEFFFSPKKRFSVCFEKEKVEWATVFFLKKRHKNRGIYDMRTKKLGEVRELLETWNHNSPPIFCTISLIW